MPTFVIILQEDRNGMIFGAEAVEGIDAALKRLAELKASGYFASYISRSF